MNLTKPTHIAFIVAALVALCTAIFFEKFCLIYVQPLTVVTILIIYFTEKKEPTSILYILAQVIGVLGGILLILGMRNYLKTVSILFSLFYVLYLRLMYIRNTKKETPLRTYFYVFLMSLPVLYIYYSALSMISSELKEAAIYFSFLMFFMLSYIITALFFYLQDKTSANLWMLIAAVNLGFMNIIIGLNELYMYETIFTVIIIFCSICIQFFVLKFMLNEDDTDIMNTIS